MYLLPLILLILLAVVAIAWSPVFALAGAGLLFIAFLAYAGLGAGTDEKIHSPPGSAAKHEDDPI